MKKRRKVEKVKPERKRRKRAKEKKAVHGCLKRSRFLRSFIALLCPSINTTTPLFFFLIFHSYISTYIFVVESPTNQNLISKQKDGRMREREVLFVCFLGVCFITAIVGFYVVVNFICSLLISVVIQYYAASLCLLQFTN